MKRILLIIVLILGLSGVVFAEETKTLEQLVAEGNAKRDAEDRARPPQTIVVQPSPVTASSQVLILVPGQVQEVRDLPDFDFPKRYTGGSVNHKRIKTFSGNFLCRIRVNDLYEVLVEKAEMLWQQKGWNPDKIRYQVVMQMSSISRGISTSPSAYLSNSTYDPSKAGGSVSQSVSVSAGGSLGWSSSEVSPMFTIIFFEVVEEVKK